MLYRGSLCVEAYALSERCVFFEGAQFFLSDHFPLLAFLDVHPCYGPTWRSGQIAARAGRGQLVQLRDRAILSENRQAKELLRLGREELSLSRQRAVVRDQGAFQREQLTAARRRRDARALLYTEAFGRESLFAESVNPLMALAAGKPVAPSTIVIHCFDFLRQTAWNDLRPFAHVGFLNMGHMCYVNKVSHVLLRVPAMSAWLEKHREVCAQGGGVPFMCSCCDACTTLACKCSPVECSSRCPPWSGGCGLCEQQAA